MLFDCFMSVNLWVQCDLWLVVLTLGVSDHFLLLFYDRVEDGYLVLLTC